MIAKFFTCEYVSFGASMKVLIHDTKREREGDRKGKKCKTISPEADKLKQMDPLEASIRTATAGSGGSSTFTYSIRENK